MFPRDSIRISIKEGIEITSTTKTFYNIFLESTHPEHEWFQTLATFPTDKEALEMAKSLCDMDVAECILHEYDIPVREDEVYRYRDGPNKVIIVTLHNDKIYRESFIVF